MLYKTIALERMTAYPAWYDRQRRAGTLRETQETWAARLRDAHLELIEELRRTRPGLDATSRSHLAGEYALQEWLAHLEAEATSAVSADD